MQCISLTKNAAKFSTIPSALASLVTARFIAKLMRKLSVTAELDSFMPNSKNSAKLRNQKCLQQDCFMIPNLTYLAF